MEKKRNKLGVHIGNRPGTNRQVDSMLDLGVHNYTVLHTYVQEADRVRRHDPGALILARMYMPDWTAHIPEDWAKYSARRHVLSLTSHVTPANEMNLSSEGGGSERADYQAINDWLVRFALKYRSLRPEDILHFPALAFGHNEREYGYELLQEALSLYDIVDYHPYWFEPRQLFDSDESLFYAFRFAKDHDTWFPDKPVFISEFGNFDTSRPSTPWEYLHFFYSLYRYSYVLGATAFIWDSAEDHASNRWVGNDALIDVIARAYKPEVEVISIRPRGYQPRVVGTRQVYSQLPQHSGKKYLPRQVADVNIAVIHHFAAHLESGDENAIWHRIQAAARSHVSRGWPGIGYHYVIDQRGVVWWTGQGDTVRYHAGNWKVNKSSIGIAYPIDGMTQGLTRAQIEATLWLLDRWEGIAGHPLQVKTHQEVRLLGPTECPGKLVIPVVEDVFKRKR